MNNSNTTKPTLFLLEDSKDLFDRVIRLAKRMGWQVIAARSLEEAKQICSDNAARVDVALIDLMVPSSEKELTKVDAFLKQRSDQGDIKTNRKSSLEEKLNADAQMDIIDKQIMSLILDDGGIQFLKFASDKNLFDNARISVAVFTARRSDKEMTPSLEKLESAVKAALGQPPHMWFDKPVNPLDLEAWLDEQKSKSEKIVV